MSLSTRNPLRMAGANVNSGFPNTGEVAMTQGGQRTFTVFSGAPGSGDCQVWAGAGRLNQILVHTQVQSGAQTVFYDAATPVSGGPLPASGHVPIGRIPVPWEVAIPGIASGQVVANPYTPLGTPIQVQMPFSSGLCVNTRSGGPGFTVAFTPETNPTNPLN